MPETRLYRALCLGRTESGVKTNTGEGGRILLSPPHYVTRAAALGAQLSGREVQSFDPIHTGQSLKGIADGRQSPVPGLTRTQVVPPRLECGLWFLTAIPLH